MLGSAQSHNLSRHLTSAHRPRRFGGGGLLLLLGAVVLLLPVAVALADDAASCLACHPATGLLQRLQTGANLAPGNELDRYLGSAHRDLTCISCHPGTRAEKHSSTPSTRQCLDCHGPNGAVSGEGGAPMAPEQHPLTAKSSPRCENCHGHHGIGRRDDRTSTVYWANIPRLCAGCHVKSSMAAIAPQVEGYISSVHGQAAASGKSGLRPAICTDCHAIHPVDRPGGDHIKPTRAEVPAICGGCHAKEDRLYAGSIHGTASARGVAGAPVCTDCHGEHNILAPTEAGSTVSTQGVVATCGRCHANESFVHVYNLPGQRLETYRASYHGIANKYGNIQAANCVSCHGNHDILPASAAASTVNPSHLSATCSRCHPGAGTKFAIGRVHLKPHLRDGWPLYLLALIYQIFVYATLAGFMLYVLLDVFARWRMWRRGLHKAFEESLARLPAPPPEALERMSVYERIEHYARLFSFLILALTGMALVFPDSAFARAVITLCGGMSGRAIMHHLAAVLLVASSVSHVLWIIITGHGRDTFRGLLPNLQDAHDAWSTVLWLTGMRDSGPCFGRFTFLEKFEYFALLWGTVVMTLTGIFLVFVNWSLTNFPKWVFDASSIIHRWEAILAVGAIAIYHLYHVVWRPGVFPGNLCWITGKLRPEEYIRDHPLDYAEAVGWLRGPAKHGRTKPSAPSERKPKDVNQ